MIPSDQTHLHVAAISHPGKSGKNNEDDYAVFAHTLSQTDPTPSVLAVLADGVGGHQAGEVASGIATKTIGNFILESDGANPVAILNDAIIQASKNVAKQAEIDQKQQGMGSTCVCAWVIRDRLYTASVGDSRIYLVRNGSIQQLTTDHTWVQEAIEHGIIRPDQARNHPQAHVIRRYLGSQNTVVPDFRLRLQPDESDQEAIENQGMELRPGEIVLLCSDGLTDLVDENEILSILQTHPNQQAVQSLVDLANDRGGHDNITIVTLEMPKSSGKTIRLKTRESQGFTAKVRWSLILVISILVVVIAALGAIFFRQVITGPTYTPLPTPTVESPELFSSTAGPTEDFSPTISTPTSPAETVIQATLTPWPTHTHPPEP